MQQTTVEETEQNQMLAENPIIVESSEDEPNVIDELKKCADVLTEKLQSDNYAEASQLIEEIVKHRDSHIYQSVGKLTRGLHDSIVNLNVDSGQKNCTIDQPDCEYNDASNRLNYVMELTQNAADKTMDMVEKSAPIAINLGLEASTLKDEWARLKNREMTPDEFRELYGRIESFLTKMDTDTNELNGNLQNIILEQGFQDLTGQVLKRVITLVTEVEENLVSLVRIASQVETIVGIDPTQAQENGNQADLDIEGEGPQVKATERDDVVTCQDDVDDLLSSLGF